MGKSISSIKKERGIGGPPMLHGEDLPKTQNKIRVKIKELREAPANFKSPAILDFAEEVFGKQTMAINITNLRALARLAGSAAGEEDTADFDHIAKKVKGTIINLNVGMVNDPQKGKLVRSLFVDA